MIQITGAQIGIVMGIVSLIGTVIGIVFWVQKPQRDLEKRVQKLEEDGETIRKNFDEYKKTHDESNKILSDELKINTGSLNKLGLEMVRLSTIIEERIPKGNPNLTPPGV